MKFSASFAHLQRRRAEGNRVGKQKEQHRLIHGAQILVAQTVRIFSAALTKRSLIKAIKRQGEPDLCLFSFKPNLQKTTAI
jgi:hypothetical protein